MKILFVVGTRPNFMKVAPLLKVMGRQPEKFKCVLVHTGQHYDERMSKSFFDDLKMPKPDFDLGVGSGSHAEQTANIMIRIEPVLSKVAPDLVVVVGDVNSTLAATLTAKKLNLRVAHIEAGLRSYDMAMPEEVNRLCIDAIADDLFTTDHFGNENLVRAGVNPRRIHFVGNVMIDTLLQYLEIAKKTDFPTALGLRKGNYAILTLHRPSNVEEPEKFKEIIDAICAGVSDMPVVFPVHPRTRSRIQAFGLSDRFTNEPTKPGIILTEPLGYIQFLSLNASARLILTDSGGLQEEATILGVPCVTLRDNTERPITVEEGTNRLAGTSREGILRAIEESLAESNVASRRPINWDGRAAERIVDIIGGFERRY